MASWIWYPGEYEIYHSNQLHTKREDLGIQYVTFWQVPSLYPRVDFFKDFFVPVDTEIKVTSKSKGFIYLDEIQYPLNKKIIIKSGNHKIQIRLMEIEGKLPCAFINSKYLQTDSTWLVSNGSAKKFSVGTLDIYDTEEKDPHIFMFSYKPIDYIEKVLIPNGVNFDFGKETYGPVTLINTLPDDEITICYGESNEESLDIKNATICEKVTGKTEYKLRSRAFRYITLFGKNVGQIKLSAEYEYLPLNEIGSFSCNDDSVKEIFDICTYTFHLNSREFFLDGIKRDHWIWSGDAYQSFMINNYLFFDSEITKRTIRALLGKPPYEQHINTINDYTLYLFISVYDYYYSTGDISFVKSVFSRLESLYLFCEARLDDNGFVCKCEDDWIFIDWSEMDKEGPICAEQILLWKANLVMAELSAVVGKENATYSDKANTLRNKIMEQYWSDQKNAFIDSFSSGKNNVSRHANIFAIIYDFVDQKTQKILLNNVLLNDSITQITTPYFKFFEMCALCKLGRIPVMQKMLKDYWGGMIKLGATTVWEAYNPLENGIQHYAMYHEKFDKSLCHAWGCGPIYLLGRYCLGVYPTKPGYKTFNIEPKPGVYKSFKGVVPLPEGKVEINYSNGLLSVFSSKQGGTLIVGGEKIQITQNKKLEVKVNIHNKNFKIKIS